MPCSPITTPGFRKIPMEPRKSNRNKTQQTKVTNFATPAAKAKLTTNAEAMEASAAASSAGSGSPFKQPEESTATARDETSTSLGTILTAINTMKAEISSKFDGILTAIENVRRDITDCSERVTQAETRISTTEDDVTMLRKKVKNLEGKNKDLEEKVLDLEARSRRSNVRLVNLPEGAEGEDTCGFLENWIPEALELQQLRGKITVERAHRLGPRRQHKTDSAPRTLIMKFLNYKDKEAVIKAARAKKQVLYNNHPVRFYQDVTAEMHKKLKEFEEARRQLRSLGLRYGMIPPARLIVTYNERSHIFNGADEAERFIKKIQSDNQSD